MGLFNAPLADEDELLQKMKQVYQPAAAGTPDPFLLAAIDFDQSGENWGAGGLRLGARGPVLYEGPCGTNSAHGRYRRGSLN